jgi:hypothetical protein
MPALTLAQVLNLPQDKEHQDGFSDTSLAMRAADSGSFILAAAPIYWALPAVQLRPRTWICVATFPAANTHPSGTSPLGPLCHVSTALRCTEIRLNFN